MTEDKRIYTIATAHLDTVWNWDFEYVIETCIPKTLDDNFALFEKYPDYRFNFEGAYRYELMEEYYPELFEKIKAYDSDDIFASTESDDIFQMGEGFVSVLDSNNVKHFYDVNGEYKQSDGYKIKL